MTEKHQDENNAGLIAKRDELLGEVRALKAKLAEVTAERDAMAAAKGKCEADLKALTIDRPTDDILTQIAVLPVRFVRPLFDEHFSVQLDEAGQLQFLTADGQPVQIDGRDAVFSAGDIQTAMGAIEEFKSVVKGNQSSGGGAPGGGRGHVSTEPVKPKKPERVAPAFGLR